MAELWVYVTWSFVGVVLLVILVALIIVCVKNKKFSTMKTKLGNILSMQNYAEDDIFQYEADVHRRSINDLNKDIEMNLDEYYSSTEEVFENNEHIRIPRVNHIRFQDHSKTAFAEEYYDNSIKGEPIPMRVKPKHPTGSVAVIHNPVAGVVKCDSNSTGNKTPSITSTDAPTSIVLESEEIKPRINPDVFSSTHQGFPRAKLVNLRGKSGSAQITSTSRNDVVVKTKKRRLPVIDPVESKPVVVKHTIRKEAITEYECPKPMGLQPLVKSYTYSSGDKLTSDNSEDETTQVRSQSLYDRRGRPLKNKTRKATEVTVHEEIGSDFVILNKKRTSKKSTKQNSSKKSPTKVKLETEQFTFASNDGIKRKNKPPPLNLSFTRHFPVTDGEKETTNEKASRSDIEGDKNDHLEEKIFEDYDQTEGDLEFSPEIQWKLKGNDNIYELVYVG